MHESISFNRQILPAADALISAVSSAALYGSGIFTTVAIYHGKLFLWEKHWRRLIDNAEKRRIDMYQHTEENTREALGELVTSNKIRDGRARLTFFDESPGIIWPYKSTRKTSLLITTGDRRPVPDNFRLTVSPHRINSLSPLAGVKSCNYLENLMAFEEANARGFDEALQLNQRGEVTAATMANLFWFSDKVLYTPSLKTGCLAGTTREFVLENTDCREVEVALDEMNSADSIFLTSAGIGVVAAAELDGKEFVPTSHLIMGLHSVGGNAG